MGWWMGPPHPPALLVLAPHKGEAVQVTGIAAFGLSPATRERPTTEPTFYNYFSASSRKPSGTDRTPSSTTLA